MKTNNLIQPTVIGYEEHKKSLRLLRVKFALFLLSLIIWSVFGWQYHKCYQSIYESEQKIMAKVYQSRLIHEVKAEAPMPITPGSDFNEWMYQEWEKAGFKRSDIKCLLKFESGGIEDRSHINSDKLKSIDRGMWMLNDKHHAEVSSKCAYDKVCSTKEAIRIAKERGNLSAWWGWVNNCQ